MTSITRLFEYKFELVIVDMKLSNSSTRDACMMAAVFFSSSEMACREYIIRARQRIHKQNQKAVSLSVHLELRLGSIYNVVT